MDIEKKQMIMQYILDFFDGERQMIISTLGFEKTKFKLNGEVNILYLNNNKYQLLDEETYEKYKDFLDELCDAQLQR